jgi:hypothetical protein
MDREIAARWTAELRSGNYHQGTGRLRYDGKYCCLGVLCDMYAKETDQGYWDAHNRFQTQANTDGNYLPEEVQKWAGMKNNSGEFTKLGKTISDSLSDMNDEGAEFLEIADVIDANVGQL